MFDREECRGRPTNAVQPDYTLTTAISSLLDEKLLQLKREKNDENKCGTQPNLGLVSCLWERVNGRVRKGITAGQVKSGLSKAKCPSCKQVLIRAECLFHEFVCGRLNWNSYHLRMLLLEIGSRCLLHRP